MLFFLWGVFRGKKENCSHLPESSKQFSTPPDIPPAIMSLTENGCSLGPIAKDVSACDDVVQTPEVSASGKLWSLLSSKVVNGDCDTKVRSVDQLDDRLDSISFSTERCTSAKLCHEISGTFVVLSILFNMCIKALIVNLVLLPSYVLPPPFQKKKKKTHTRLHVYKCVCIYIHTLLLVSSLFVSIL